MDEKPDNFVYEVMLKLYKKTAKYLNLAVLGN